MKRSSLEFAKLLMSQRRFSRAITVLETNADFYEENFEYFVSLGTCFLYVGDFGSASRCYRKARTIKIQDTRLLLGQAAILIRQGDTGRAIKYYFEILDIEPGNKIAKKALEFIRLKGDFDTICNWVESGRLSRFYPPVGINSLAVASSCFVCIVVLAVSLFAYSLYNPKIQVAGPRGDLTSLALTEEERKNPLEADLSGLNISYILNASQIRDGYRKAFEAFQKGDDNEVQVEINRLLNSNASFAIKQKMQRLMGWLKDRTFDTIQTNYNYSQVQQDLPLYLDCWVVWSGRIANGQELSGSYSCELLIGYEDMQRYEGPVAVHFERSPQPPIEGEKPVKIIGKITMRDGRLCLEGKGVFQSVTKGM